MDQQQAQPQPLTLHYDKRRYDGGPEIELIAYLESQAQARAQAQEQIEAMKKSVQEETEIVAPVAHSKSRRIIDTLMTGPFEMIVGALGVVTTTVAWLAFSHLKHQDLSSQSKSIFKDSIKTLVQGVLHTILSPGKALHVAVVG